MDVFVSREYVKLGMLKVTSALLVVPSSLYSPVAPMVTSTLPLLVESVYVPLLVDGICKVIGPLLVLSVQVVASTLPVTGPFDVEPLSESALMLVRRRAPLLVWMTTFPPSYVANGHSAVTCC